MSGLAIIARLINPPFHTFHPIVINSSKMADDNEQTSSSIRFNAKRRPRPRATADREQLKLRSKAPSHRPMRFQRQRIARTSKPASVGRRGAHAYRSALKPFVTNVFSRMINNLQKMDYRSNRPDFWFNFMSSSRVYSRADLTHLGLWIAIPNKRTFSWAVYAACAK